MLNTDRESDDPIVAKKGLIHLEPRGSFVGEPDAGNPQVRFDEGEQWNRLRPPAALYSTG